MEKPPTPNHDAGHRLLTIEETGRRIGLSKVSVYRLIKRDPSFPRPLKLSARCTRFASKALDRWIAAQAEGAQA